MSEKVEKLRYLMGEVAEFLLKEGTPHIITPGYEYFREVLSLYAKQHNMLESTLVLLDNNMAEEAYILLRSMLNNKMWIINLCDDDGNRSRLKQYLDQPIINRYNLLVNIKNVKDKQWFREQNANSGNKIDLDEICKEIQNLKKTMKQRGITSTTPVSVASLAKSNELLFALYIAMYSDASQHEHSDPSVLGLYRKELLGEYDNNTVYAVDLASTSEELKEKVLKFAIDIYGYSFIHIVKHITDREEQLLVNYNKVKLLEIMVRFSRM